MTAKKRKRKKRVLLIVFIFLLIMTISLGWLLVKMRPVVLKYSENTAKRILFDIANQAIAEVLEDENLKYENMANIRTGSDGKITAIELDAVAINMLKSKITLRISNLTKQNEEFSTYIPLGTFLGNEYTNGLGPKVKFSMQLTSYTIVNFQNEFKESAMNQSLHRVTLDVEIFGNLVMAGARNSFQSEATAIIAETVIIGDIPDAYTEVIESSIDETADKVNDYGASLN